MTRQDVINEYDKLIAYYMDNIDSITEYNVTITQSMIDILVNRVDELKKKKVPKHFSLNNKKESNEWT